jgi:hypothetical protein
MWKKWPAMSFQMFQMCPRLQQFLNQQSGVSAGRRNRNREAKSAVLWEHGVGNGCVAVSKTYMKIHLTCTLWLCQNSYWKWPFIVSFPIKNFDFP